MMSYSLHNFFLLVCPFLNVQILNIEEKIFPFSNYIPVDALKCTELCYKTLMVTNFD